MLFLICGEYKTGKTVSACTFPKPLLLFDYDNGFTSVKTTRSKDGQLIVPPEGQITVIPFYKDDVQDLDFKTSIIGKSSEGAPKHTRKSMDFFKKYNDVIKELYTNKSYKDVKYKTIVIDSLTSMFRVWKEAIMSVNNIPSLRIADYGSLEGVLYSQFIPTLKTLLAENIVEHIILVDHIDIEKDEITGAIIEYPIGPSRNMGRNMGLHFDEIYRQKQEGEKYVWRTRKTGFFQAGSRLNIIDGVEANYKNLESILKANFVGIK